MLAEALGGEVGPMARPEVGLAEVSVTPAGREDPLLDGLGPTLEALQWHGAEVKRLPEGAVVLASNAACPVQAFRWGRHAYGFQCHIEITHATVADWDRVPEYKASLDLVLGPRGASDLTRAVTAKLPAFRRVAQRIDDNLSAVIGDRARP